MRNVVLAVGGTLQEGVIAETLTGEPVTQFDSVRYKLNSLADTVRLQVTPNGLLTGVGVSSVGILVNVAGFAHNTIQGDQVLVQVTAMPVLGLTLSIQPPPGDSTKLANGTAKTIMPVLRNPTAGVSVTGTQIQYDVRRADETRLGVYTGGFRFCSTCNAFIPHVRYNNAPTVNPNQISPFVSAGSAWVYANVNAYGTLLQDSVLYTFTYPYTATVAASKTNLAVMTTIDGQTPALSPGLSATLTLAPGAIITFSNGVAATDPLTVAYAFDNPAAATAPAISPSTTGGASGSVTSLNGAQNSRRQFLTPGTYHWTMVTAGGPAPWPGQTFTGTVIIK